jgi:hypothetical protein
MTMTEAKRRNREGFKEWIACYVDHLDDSDFRALFKTVMEFQTRCHVRDWHHDREAP